MTRIIAGVARGLRLAVPAAGTRPTSDRVRESLFGALESADAITGARVLDLYAGSGALGLEALSRGAASADLVELSKGAAAIVRRNAQTVSTAAKRPATVHHGAVLSYLQRSQSTFDLVFSDPPYDIDDDAMTADLVALAPRLSADALVVIERAKRSTPPDLASAGLELVRDKLYGDTALWWAQPAAESQSR
jgi:16S rRNA (guanine966-N2)-methyltransferase